MLSLEFHPDVSQEVREGYRWYESKSAGLGEDFLNELESAYNLIIELPDTWPIISNSFRRYILKRFPYGVIYKINQDRLIIVAVMHLSREPSYWRERAE